MVIGDSEVFPIPSEAIPTDTNGGLFSIILVVAFFLPGAETTKKDGRDRLEADLEAARKAWQFPIAQIAPGIHLTNEDLGPNFNLPAQLGDVQIDSPAMLQLRRIRRDFMLKNNHISTKVVTIWYAPFPQNNSTGAIARSWANVKEPDYTGPSDKANYYQHIIVSNNANNGNNESTISHELGHIFFGTASEKVDGKLVYINPNGCDPTAPQCRANTPEKSYPEDRHSPTTLIIAGKPTPNDNNIMNPAAGNKTVLLSSQLELAAKTFLFL